MTTAWMRPPTVLVVAADQLGEEFDRRRGSNVQTTLELPREPWWLADAKITCVVAVRSPSVVRPLLEALVRGVDLVVALAADGEPWMEPLRRDLGRVALVANGQLPQPDPLDRLNEDQRQLLELLGQGASIPEAARALFLSVRTAERRVGAARRLLGVRSTAEAVVLCAGRAVGS